jgi:hypothetical protein
MRFKTPDPSSMSRRVKAEPRRSAPGLQSTAPQINTRQVNFLSTEPRPITTSFDDDGPGTQSPHGPRLDNDHVFIKDIRILPSTDEILSIDRPSMPRKNLDQDHFLVNGPLRHFDTLFRHLRFDSVETIRDICYHASQNLTSTPNHTSISSESRQETPAGNRYFDYQGVRIEEINIEERERRHRQTQLRLS